VDTSRWLTAALALGLTACSAAKEPDTVLRRAQTAMGEVRSITYSASGKYARYGQGLTAGEPWRQRELSGFTRTINYDQRAMRDEVTFGPTVVGRYQPNEEVRGDKAWGIGAQGPTPQIAAAEERQLHIWLTPHGFVKAAMAAADTIHSEGEGTDVISFTVLGRYPISGTFDDRGFLTRVQTVVPDPVLGDAEIVVSYSDYREFGGIRFPARIEIEQGGFPLWELNVATVTPNVPFDLPVPENVATATILPERVASTKVADGAWHVTGGPQHHSLLVEFAEFLAVVEAPDTEARSLAVIEEAGRLAPGKPIRYVVATHHHFDHTGGLRTYVAGGATVVTHHTNVEYTRQTLLRRATVAPDRLSLHPRAPTIVGVSDKYEITDGKQTLEVYAASGDDHTTYYALAYLPGPKIIVQNDSYTPGPGEVPPPAMPPENALAFYESLQPLKLDVRTIVPIHGPRAFPMAEFLKFIGKK
jgi:glyoxylase-like metal-dependent hydrolase (beta-lactamase superfamily II)